MNKIYFIGCLIILSSVYSSDAAPAFKNGYNSPQILPEKDGYVPVYIRVGETPLSDINYRLAEAFHEEPTSNNDNVIVTSNAADDVHEK